MSRIGRTVVVNRNQILSGYEVPDSINSLRIRRCRLLLIPPLVDDLVSGENPTSIPLRGVPTSSAMEPWMQPRSALATHECDITGESCA
jgi:hypothetical protein